ncbi:MAG: hypothetical protein ABFS56_02010 [Pseudomonadota bacterium]
MTNNRIARLAVNEEGLVVHKFIRYLSLSVNKMNVRAIKRESKEIDALQQTLAPDGMVAT